MSDLCTFDSTLTTFDSTARTFDQTTCQAVVETPPVAGGGGGVANWPGRSERSWDKWWQKEHAKRLQKKKEAAEKKVQKLEVKVRDTRDDLSKARFLGEMKSLILELERLQTLLAKEQAIFDELEMQEVKLAWQAWSRD